MMLVKVVEWLLSSRIQGVCQTLLLAALTRLKELWEEMREHEEANGERTVMMRFASNGLSVCRIELTYSGYQLKKHCLLLGFRAWGALKDFWVTALGKLLGAWCTDAIS